ncbi:MAG: hypothetical protein K9H16_15275 [Bacteroidales bacterium]|nr:hypothetical protein [Bacteroidales bacterium]
MEEQTLGIGSRVKHPEFGAGVIIQAASDTFEIVFMEHGWRKISRSYQGLEIIDVMEPDRDMISYEQVESMIVRVLRRYSDLQEIVEMGDKWTGGKMILQPGRTDLASKEIPIETFFHKIVMVRDRVRVMEQRINSSNLSDEDKVNLQQYITRIYGSLTTFNVLFQFKADYFTGEKS